VIIIGGGDEAGRGPLIGPLILSLVLIKSSASIKLSGIGVRDSKMLSRKKRDLLYNQIKDIAFDIKVDSIEAEEINNAMKSNISLNELEAVHFAKLFDSVSDDTFVSKVYLDSPDRIAEKFGIRFSASSYKNTVVQNAKQSTKKGVKYTKIIAEHKADVKYPVVSAASIIAKVTRDIAMDEISSSLGIDLGSGYPSDHKAIDNLRENLSNKELSKYVRTQWSTMKTIRQMKLRNF